MTDVAVAYSDAEGSDEAGSELAAKLRETFGGEAPDAVIVFASSRYEYAPFLKALMDGCSPGVLVGCSSAGEFISGSRGEGAASALALRSDEMLFTASLARNLRDNAGGARELISHFQGLEKPAFAHRSALLLTDALAGRTEQLIEELTAFTGGTYKFFGGGAGDDAKFTETHVFLGTEAATDAMVALEILSKKPIGVGVSHGWLPASEPMRVTEARGSRLFALNSIPAAEVFEEHARATGQSLPDRDAPVPFFLHNVIGIRSEGGYKLRVPLAIEADGSIVCASDIPQGATVCIMKSAEHSAAEAARHAVSEALKQTSPAKPRAALFFDCVATRLRLGAAFETELGAVKSMLGDDTVYVGCNTYGQIARAENQFSGFHNCTAVVCTFPE